MLEPRQSIQMEFFDETLKLTKKQICSNSFNSGYDDIILEREFYEIKFLLTLTDLQENYNIGNHFFIILTEI